MISIVVNIIGSRVVVVVVVVVVVPRIDSNV